MSNEMRKCTCHDVAHPRDSLTVKRVSFAAMGRNGRVIKSRTVGWLCPLGLQADQDFNREKYFDSPGLEVEGTT